MLKKCTLSTDKIKNHLTRYAESIRIKLENLTLSAWMDRAKELTIERNEVLTLIKELDG